VTDGGTAMPDATDYYVEVILRAPDEVQVLGACAR